MRETALRLSLLISLGAFLAQPAFAQEYTFKGGAKPESNEEIKFKLLPADSGKKADEYVAEAEAKSTNLFKAPLGYPKKEFFATYNPGFNGFKNTLTGASAYSYGGNSTAAGTFGWRYIPSLEEDFAVTADYMNIGVEAGTEPNLGLTFKESNVALYTLGFQANFCKVKDNAFHRFCWGPRLNLDSFPTLAFPSGSNTEMELTAVRDTTLGVGIRYERPLFGSTNFIGGLAWDHGFGLGQKSDLSTKSNDKVSGLAGFQWGASRIKWNAAAGFDYRAAKMESTQDKWDIQNVSYAGHLGVAYEWGSL